MNIILGISIKKHVGDLSPNDVVCYQEFWNVFIAPLFYKWITNIQQNKCLGQG